MVTWGQNQVHTFGQGTSATTPATPGAAPAFSFGSSPMPAPAPPAAPFFGSTPAAAPPSGGLFGAASPAPSTGAFGISSAPSTGVFGSSPAPSAGLFGAPAPSPGSFGTPTAPSTPAIAAQVAFQSYLQETNRQETVRLQSALEKLYNGYRGARFVTILYNDMTPEQHQWQWSIMKATSGLRHPLPPTPPIVSEQEWIDKCVKNPDPESYMPSAIAGAETLQARLASQQDRSQDLEKKLDSLRGAQASLQTSHERFQTALTSLTATHVRLRQRLLDVMRKVELVRCRNLPLQVDEAKLAQQLHAVSTQVAQLAQLLSRLQQQVHSTPARPTTARVALPDKTQLHRVLVEQREALTTLSDAVQQDADEISLLQQTVVHGQVPPLPTYS